MVRVSIHDFMNLRGVEFDVEGLTLLRGASGSGKSSVLRCLQGLFTNRFRSGCVRWGCSCFTVDVTFSDGLRLGGRKGMSGGVSYLYNGVSFEKVGRAVPAEIQSALNLGSYGSSPASLHFWNQFGTPWLLGSSCGVDALGFGEAVRLCDTAGKSLGDDLKDIRSRSRGVTQILSAQKALLLDVDRLLSQGSVLEGRVRCAQDALAACQRRQTGLGQLQERCRQLQAMRGFISALSAVQSRMDSLVASESRIQALFALRTASLQTRLISGQVSVLGRMYAAIPHVLSLYNRVMLLQSLRSSLTMFTVLEGYISSHLSLEATLLAELRRVEVLAELTRLLHSLSEVRDRISVLTPLTVDSVCPLCGHKL